MEFKGGWIGKILRVDLSKESVKEEDLSKELALEWIGGRGFAIKILWDELEPGIDPLSPENKVVIATGPLTGTITPSSGKLVVATKSPLTGGYGDGNIGTHFAHMLKMSGYDALVLEGRAKKPVYVYITPNGVEIKDASHLWGKSAIETEITLRKDHGKDVGVISIGPAAENLVKFSVVISEYGRAGGRPGIGTVLGSKKVKALVAEGWNDIPVADIEKAFNLAWEARMKLLTHPGYRKWINQGTMMTIEWSQEASVLPTYNFSEGVFDDYANIGGEIMEKEYKLLRKGCFSCPMPCGNLSIAKLGKFMKTWAELDYENVAMLGSNIGIDDMNIVIKLNRLADEWGVDTISLGNAIGFAIELYQKGIISQKQTGGLELKWGDEEVIISLAEKIVKKEDIGKILAEGVKAAAEKIGKEAPKYAIHVKGLEVSAYDCHAAPGMALSYGTSPIGAHHKDAWVISWEVKIGRDKIDKSKVDKVIEFQRIRGGLFEILTVCRLPWIELALDLDYYPKLFNAITGLDYTLENFFFIADKIYNLIRAFWIREYGEWKREYDYPPRKWFEIPLSKGPLAGSKLKKEAYDKLLDWYYEERGWDKNGIPRKSTLEKFGLSYVISTLEERGVTLSE
ncbi:MAG: aldehyde ferredoxin oxidoreductase family protein [Candidatus Njordarchaeales archaeon]